MRGRLTLEKVNAAVNDMASYAEANAHLVSAPKQKVFIYLHLSCSALSVTDSMFVMLVELAENLWEKALVSYISF